MGDGLFAMGRWGMKHRLDFQIATLEGRGAYENVVVYRIPDEDSLTSQIHLENEWNACVIC
jgi:hypothetical protein